MDRSRLCGQDVFLVTVETVIERREGGDGTSDDLGGLDLPFYLPLMTLLSIPRILQEKLRSTVGRTCTIPTLSTDLRVGKGLPRENTRRTSTYVTPGY